MNENKMPDKQKLVIQAINYTGLYPEKMNQRDFDFVSLAERVINQDEQFVIKLTDYLYSQGNRRTVSILLATLIIITDKTKTELLFDIVTNTVDDMCKLVDFYKSITNKPYLSVIKKNISRKLNQFDEKTLLSFTDSKKNTNLKDLILICHPIATDERRNWLFKGIIDKSVRPESLQRTLSVNGNNKDVWQKLIDEDKLTYLQKLSNLKHLINNNIDVTDVLEDICDFRQIEKIKPLPIRYYNCYKVLKDNGLLNQQIADSLNKAIECLAGELEELKGNCLLAVDVSGSMMENVGINSLAKYVNVAQILALILKEKCQNSTLMYFSAASDDVDWLKGKIQSKGYSIDEIKNEPVLEKCCRDIPVYSTITDLHLPLRWLEKQDEVFDRIVYFTDFNHNSDYNSISEDIKKYRNRHNIDCWVHIIDVKGQIENLIDDEKVSVIPGWGINTISLIPSIENGISDLINEIEKIKI